MSQRKSIIVTGASSGIGAALTKAFADDGHRLFICARRVHLLERLASQYSNISYAPCDVSSESAVIGFFEKVAAEMGDVDALIHCAAVPGPVGPITKIDSVAWTSALQTDLFGALYVTKHATKLMPPERRSRILLLSGGGAFDPMPNLSAYGVAKAGIVRLAETLAVELAASNIAVNVFAPGFVATEIIRSIVNAGPDLGGELYNIVVKLLENWKGDDIEIPINCARFLISDAAAPLTGKTISARFDPWGHPEFVAALSDILSCRVFATQRANLDDFKERDFARRLLEIQRQANSNSG